MTLENQHSGPDEVPTPAPTVSPQIPATLEELAKPALTPQVQHRLDQFTSGFPQPVLRDTNGEFERTVQTSPQKGIESYLDTSTDSRLVKVATGSGALVPHGREVMTEWLMGCIGVYITGPNGKALFHMTPKTRLPYEKPRVNESVQRIAEAVRALGDPGQCHTVIVANLVGAPDDAERRAEWEHVKQLFHAAGMIHTKVEEVPLDQTIIYQSPEQPDQLLIVGNRRFINPKGFIDEAGTRNVRHYLVPTNTDTPQTYDIQQTDADAVRKQEVYDRAMKLFFPNSAGQQSEV